MTKQTDVKIPVIIDTDIGSDIDDMWALAFALKSPELDIKLIVSDSGDTVGRAKIVAKMLEVAERTDIPVAVGIPLDSTQALRQGDWVADYQLEAYPGEVYHDGIGAIIDTIMSSPETITILALGPVPNLAAALQREPRIVEKAKIVGMHGSIREGRFGSPKIIPTYNVMIQTKACQMVFEADWDIALTPVDSCSWARLRGDKYRAVRDCQDPLIQALIENYRLWAPHAQWVQGVDVEYQSSTLYDVATVYLAFSDELFEMERLGIRVTDDAYTLIDDDAKAMDCAMGWKDLAAFEDLMVERLTSDCLK